ncbi:MAG TPA: GNAT family protein [Sphingomonas sp.]|nr:GNAT family protein [Sphingomonas sp.]
MSFLFYAIDPAGAAPLDAALPADVGLRWWRPALDGLPPRGPNRGRNLCWWGLHRLGLLADRRFAELSLWCGGRALHRLVLTPRWHRFPFMADGDLQIGDVWTAPDARGRGFAWAAIGEALRAGAGARRLWYVVDAANVASVHLIERAGFARVGIGRRTRPLGIALAGRFVPDEG